MQDKDKEQVFVDGTKWKWDIQLSEEPFLHAHSTLQFEAHEVPDENVKKTKRAFWGIFGTWMIHLVILISVLIRIAIPTPMPMEDLTVAGIMVAGILLFSVILTEMNVREITMLGDIAYGANWVSLAEKTNASNHDNKRFQCFRNALSSALNFLVRENNESE